MIINVECMKIQDIAAYLLKSTGAPVEIERYGYAKLILKLEAESVSLFKLIHMVEICEGSGNCSISIVDGKFAIEIPLRKDAKLGTTRKERKEMNRKGYASRPIRSRAYYTDVKPQKEVVFMNDDWLEKSLNEFSKEMDESLTSSLDELSQLGEDST